MRSYFYVNRVSFFQSSVGWLIHWWLLANSADMLYVAKYVHCTCRITSFVENIVARIGVDATFHDPGLIDPDRGMGSRGLT